MSASQADSAIRPLRHPPTTPAVASSPSPSGDSWCRVQETINRLQKPLHGSVFVPILEDPADVLTNIIVLSRDAPDFYDKHKRKVTTLGDALEWYSEHRPDFIAALDAASGQPSVVGFHTMGVALRDLVLHHGWQQSSGLAFITKIMARPASPVAALANLVIKAYLKLTDPETANFVVCCQEGLDKDSVSALLDDIDKLAPSEPLYLSPGMARLDPAATLACQDHWTDLWVCLAAVCCSRSTDLAAFEKQRSAWFIRGDPKHYLARQPGTALFPAISTYEQEWQRLLSAASILGVGLHAQPPGAGRQRDSLPL